MQSKIKWISLGIIAMLTLVGSVWNLNHQQASQVVLAEDETYKGYAWELEGQRIEEGYYLFEKTIKEVKVAGEIVDDIAFDVAIFIYTDELLGEPDYDEPFESKIVVTPIGCEKISTNPIERNYQNQTFSVLECFERETDRIFTAWIDFAFELVEEDKGILTMF